MPIRELAVLAFGLALGTTAHYALVRWPGLGSNIAADLLVAAALLVVTLIAYGWVEFRRANQHLVALAISAATVAYVLLAILDVPASRSGVQDVTVEFALPSGANGTGGIVVDTQPFDLRSCRWPADLHVDTARVTEQAVLETRVICPPGLSVEQVFLVLHPPQSPAAAGVLPAPFRLVPIDQKGSYLTTPVFGTVATAELPWMLCLERFDVDTTREVELYFARGEWVGMTLPEPEERGSCVNVIYKLRQARDRGSGK